MKNWLIYDVVKDELFEIASGYDEKIIGYNLLAYGLIDYKDINAYHLIGEI